ncbi:MAG: J domain-containing protein [Roseitalea porphyridii]|uniref:J domain-containing protein n=1 Tax=Roseitalea porphyridii TaxID=1852022 RepID=UPI0032EF984C
MPGSSQKPFERSPFDEGPRLAADATDQAPHGGLRRCDRPGCAAEGQHRAPRSRDALNSFYWFCLEHVREYNLAWDYFKDMDEDAIEQSRRRDAVWQRPTWPLNGLGRHGTGPQSRPFGDDFGFFHEERAGSEECKGRFPPNSRQAKALRTLELAPNAGLAEVKQRYKSLVKALHPDVTGGNARSEERLKIVNLAYSDLKAAFE